MTEDPWTISVSRTGTAYLVSSDTWDMYAVDLATLACSRTLFRRNQLGIATSFGIAVSRTGSADQMFFFGESNGQGPPILAVSDLTTFQLQEVGPALPDVPQLDNQEYDTQADLYGHIFVLTQTGLLVELDAATGKVLGAVDTGTNPTQNESWAVMTYEAQVYMFTNTTVATYDFATGVTTTLGNVDVMNYVVGASAVPCIEAR